MCELTLHETLWQKYNRGLQRIVGAYLVIVVYVGIPLMVLAVKDAFNDFPILRASIGIALGIGLIVGIPLLAAWDDRSIRTTPDETRASRQGIDSIVKLLEIDVDRDWLGVAAELLNRGEADSARRVLHEKTSTPWDGIDKLIERWPETAMRRKIELIVEKINRGTSPMLTLSSESPFLAASAK